MWRACLRKESVRHVVRAPAGFHLSFIYTSLPANSVHSSCWTATLRPTHIPFQTHYECVQMEMSLNPQTLYVLLTFMSLFVKGRFKNTKNTSAFICPHRVCSVRSMRYVFLMLPDLWCFAWTTVPKQPCSLAQLHARSPHLKLITGNYVHYKRTEYTLSFTVISWSISAV